MKFPKRAIVLTLAVILLASMTMLAAADGVPAVAPSTGYGSVSGSVAEVADNGGGYYSVRVEGADGEITVFIVTPDTCRVYGDPPAAGDEFTGFYDLNMPVPMIYPPQYQAVAFYVNLDKKYVVKVSRFDDDLLSADGELIVHVGGDTAVLQANGEEFIGGADALGGRALAVLYTMATLSIPPQTTPEKIFVLYELAVPALGDADIDAANGTVMVNGADIAAPAPYVKGSVPMAPLRAVAEALGYAVTWEGATQSVRLGDAASLTVGKDSYTADGKAPVALGTAPEIVAGTTYVPLDFFKRVLGVKYVALQEGVLEVSDLPDVVIFVNGEDLTAPAPFFKGSVLMTPLRAVAEELDYEVVWDAATRSVRLDDAVSLIIGKDSYTVEGTPMALGAAPEIVDGSTYVPLGFFRRVLGMNNAYYFEGAIEINDDEPME